MKKQVEMKDSMKKSEMTDKQINDLLLESAFSKKIAGLINQLNELSGINYSVREVLSAVMKSLGGSNVRIYYQIDTTFFYADAYTGQSICDQIGDFNVVAVFETGEVRSCLPGITDA
ncbi:MAG TPA: hypothetical protein PKH79_12100, partial [Prolixibacteraceae bacterium]|nr:hypothetical protein [Prolixibacteraceae bacterium]